MNDLLLDNKVVLQMLRWNLRSHFFFFLNNLFTDYELVNTPSNTAFQVTSTVRENKQVSSETNNIVEKNKQEGCMITESIK